MIKKNILIIIVLIFLGITIWQLYVTKFHIKPLSIINNRKQSESKTKLVENGIYQYTDANGNLVVTNKHVPLAKKIKLPPLNVYASPMTANDLYANGYTRTQTMDNIQNYNFITKYQPMANINEGSRTKVLTEELTYEENELNQALWTFNDTKKNKLSTDNNQQYGRRLQTLQDAIYEHQKNIAILKKTLNYTMNE